MNALGAKVVEDLRSTDPREGESEHLCSLFKTAPSSNSTLLP